jgi:hypothetical protein
LTFSRIEARPLWQEPGLKAEGKFARFQGTQQAAEKRIQGCKKCQGTTSQAAEKRIQGCKKRQGTTSQAAEKRTQGCKKCQGTTSVVP